jgi:hypothetical protein
VDEEYRETRQERRERKLTGKRERVKKHGRNLAQLYKAAIAKRINKLRSDKKKGRESPE